MVTVSRNLPVASTRPPAAGAQPRVEPHRRAVPSGAASSRSRRLRANTWMASCRRAPPRARISASTCGWSLTFQARRTACAEPSAGRPSKRDRARGAAITSGTAAFAGSGASGSSPAARARARSTPSRRPRRSRGSGARGSSSPPRRPVVVGELGPLLLLAFERPGTAGVRCFQAYSRSSARSSALSASSSRRCRARPRARARRLRPPCSGATNAAAASRARATARRAAPGRAARGPARSRWCAGAPLRLVRRVEILEAALLSASAIACASSGVSLPCSPMLARIAARRSSSSRR